jgi:hypothetical protein
MFDFRIIPSKADINKLSGLFGNYNGDSRDDLVSLRNLNILENDFDKILDSFK